MLKENSRFKYNGPWDVFEESLFSQLQKGDQIVIYKRWGLPTYKKVTVTKVTKRVIMCDNKMRYNRSNGKIYGNSDDFHTDRIQVAFSSHNKLMTWEEADQMNEEKENQTRIARKANLLRQHFAKKLTLSEEVVDQIMKLIGLEYTEE